MFHINSSSATVTTLTVSFIENIEKCVQVTSAFSIVFSTTCLSA